MFLLLQVKSGGHAYNLGFSSTTGVQISLVRFNGLTVNRAARTVTLGTGLTWDQVYQRLEPFGIMVAGARLPGIGAFTFVLNYRKEAANAEQLQALGVILLVEDTPGKRIKSA